MKAIGPNFANEMRAAAINLDGIAWGTDGQIVFRGDVQQQVRDAVAAVYAAHDPLTPAPADVSVSEINALETAKRSRAAKIEEIERRMSLGAPQEEVNVLLLNLLKE